MTQRGYPEKAPFPQAGGGSGTYQAGKAVTGNLAVQTSIMQIFDAFTEVISGELKTMQLEESLPEAPLPLDQPKP